MSRFRMNYRDFTVSLDDLAELDEEELAMADRIADMVAAGGAPRPDRLEVLQVAVDILVEELRDKSEEEITRFFVERAAQRAATPRVH